MRIGSGFDVHRLVKGRELILGGVSIDYPFGLLGHSDADVLTHSLCDALLGALALGDIGEHYPDHEPKWKGVSSLVLLADVMEKVKEQGYSLVNCDLTLLAQAPKISPYKEKIRANLAQILGCDLSCISLKATTTEELGFVGRGEGMAAISSVLLEKVKSGTL